MPMTSRSVSGANSATRSFARASNPAEDSTSFTSVKGYIIRPDTIRSLTPGTIVLPVRLLRASMQPSGAR